MRASAALLCFESEGTHINDSKAYVRSLNRSRVCTERSCRSCSYLIRVKAPDRDRHGYLNDLIGISRGYFSEIYRNGEILCRVAASRHGSVKPARNSRLTSAADVITLLLSKTPARRRTK